MDTITAWQLKCNNNNQRLAYMFEHCLFTDCMFLVGRKPDQKVIKAHKAILASASPVFAAMFYGEMAERQSPIPIIDIQPKTFRAMLINIYSETTPISSLNEACSLYCAVDKYSILTLKQKCVNYIDSHSNTSNVCKIYEFASLYEDKHLIETCERVMFSDTRQLFREKSFLEGKLSTILAIFSMDFLNCFEMDLFEALQKYLTAQKITVESTIDQGSEKKSIARILLQKVRFLTLNSEDFALGPAKSDLLTDSDKLAILMNLATKKSHIPMPPGFSTSREDRRG